MNNVNVDIIKGTSKKGNAYECLEFSIDCGGGVVYRNRAFPSPLEMQVIKQKLGKMAGIYSADTSASNEVF